VPRHHGVQVLEVRVPPLHCDLFFCVRFAAHFVHRDCFSVHCECASTGNEDSNWRSLVGGDLRRFADLFEVVSIHGHRNPNLNRASSLDCDDEYLFAELETDREALVDHLPHIPRFDLAIHDQYPRVTWLSETETYLAAKLSSAHCGTGNGEVPCSIFGADAQKHIRVKNITNTVFPGEQIGRRMNKLKVWVHCSVVIEGIRLTSSADAVVLWWKFGCAQDSLHHLHNA